MESCDHAALSMDKGAHQVLTALLIALDRTSVCTGFVEIAAAYFILGCINQLRSSADRK